MSEDVLVTADWVEDHIEAFERDDPAYRLVEVNNPAVTDEAEHMPYERAHVPGATFFDWERDFTDERRRTILDRDAFARLNGEAGITEDSTVVIYGNGRVPNWYGMFAYWVYSYYGHADVRALDGGKQYWLANDYPTTTEVPTFTPRTYEPGEPDESIRAYKDDINAAIESDTDLLDGRTPAEFAGEVIAPEGLEPTAQQAGHIPGATNVPMPKVHDEDGTYKDPEELRALYAEAGLEADDETVTYCRLGERSSIEWFLLHELLGFESVQNYDGSWTEWGNLIDAPIATAEDGD
jgi:thiosulfate/3-mercaptopyruvate sulfurtransferase